MSAEVAFQIVSALPMPIWLIWFLAPRSALARYFARALWPWLIIGMCYVVGFVYALVAGGGMDPAAFGSLQGVMALFQSEWGVLVGWIHYLAFDLFVARWMMNDAPEAGYALIPCLVLTLMAGPAGLMLYILMRPWLARRELIQNHNHQEGAVV